MPDWLAILVAVLGGAAVSTGVAFIYWPAGLILAGVLAMTAGLLAESPSTKTAGRPSRGRPQRGR